MFHSRLLPSKEQWSTSNLRLKVNMESRRHEACSIMQTRQMEAGDTWGQCGPHPLEAAECGHRGLDVGQLPERLPRLCLDRPGGVDANQVGQLGVKLTPLQKGNTVMTKNVKRGRKQKNKKNNTARKTKVVTATQSFLVLKEVKSAACGWYTNSLW